MNGDITLAAPCQCQRASKVIPPFIIMPPPHRAEALSYDARLTSVCLCVMYIGPKSRTEAWED